MAAEAKQFTNNLIDKNEKRGLKDFVSEIKRVKNQSDFGKLARGMVSRARLFKSAVN